MLKKTAALGVVGSGLAASSGSAAARCINQKLVLEGKGNEKADYIVSTNSTQVGTWTDWEGDEDNIINGDDESGLLGSVSPGTTDTFTTGEQKFGVKFVQAKGKIRGKVKAVNRDFYNCPVEELPSFDEATISISGDGDYVIGNWSDENLSVKRGDGACGNGFVYGSVSGDGDSHEFQLQSDSGLSRWPKFFDLRGQLQVFFQPE